MPPNRLRAQVMFTGENTVVLIFFPTRCCLMMPFKHSLLQTPSTTSSDKCFEPYFGECYFTIMLIAFRMPSVNVVGLLSLLSDQSNSSCALRYWMHCCTAATSMDVFNNLHFSACKSAPSWETWIFIFIGSTEVFFLFTNLTCRLDGVDGNDNTSSKQFFFLLGQLSFFSLLAMEVNLVEFALDVLSKVRPLPLSVAVVDCHNQDVVLCTCTLPFDDLI